MTHVLLTSQCFSAIKSKDDLTLVAWSPQSPPPTAKGTGTESPDLAPILLMTG